MGPYAKEDLLVHVLAFRINTELQNVNVLVTDYTPNERIVGEWSRTMAEELPKEEIVNIRISVEDLLKATAAHEAKHGVALNIKESENNWADVKSDLCVARFSVGFLPKMTFCSGSAKFLPVDYASQQYTDLLSRLRDRWPVSFFQQNSQAALAVLGLVLLAETKLLLALESESLVKEEEIKEEPAPPLQNSMQNILQPASQYFSAQRQESQESPIDSESQISDAQSQRNEILTQLLQANEDEPEVDSLESDADYSLGHLSGLSLAMAGNRIFHTKAVVVGTVPGNLTHVCTKTYSKRHGKLELGDPQAFPLELILAELAEPTELSAENSLSVVVPPKQLLSFFGVDVTEQLYTRAGRFDQQFRQRGLKFVDFDLVQQDNQWQPRNLRFSSIL